MYFSSEIESDDPSKARWCISTLDIESIKVSEKDPYHFTVLAGKKHELRAPSREIRQDWIQALVSNSSCSCSSSDGKDKHNQALLQVFGDSGFDPSQYLDKVFQNQDYAKVQATMTELKQQRSQSDAALQNHVESHYRAYIRATDEIQNIQKDVLELRMGLETCGQRVTKIQDHVVTKSRSSERPVTLTCSSPAVAQYPDDEIFPSGDFIQMDLIFDLETFLAEKQYQDFSQLLLKHFKNRTTVVPLEVLRLKQAFVNEIRAEFEWTRDVAPADVKHYIQTFAVYLIECDEVQSACELCVEGFRTTMIKTRRLDAPMGKMVDEGSSMIEGFWSSLSEALAMYHALFFPHEKVFWPRLEASRSIAVSTIVCWITDQIQDFVRQFAPLWVPLSVGPLCIKDKRRHVKSSHDRILLYLHRMVQSMAEVETHYREYPIQETFNIAFRPYLMTYLSHNMREQCTIHLEDQDVKEQELREPKPAFAQSSWARNGIEFLKYYLEHLLRLHSAAKPLFQHPAVRKTISDTSHWIMTNYMDQVEQYFTKTTQGIHSQHMIDLVFDLYYFQVHGATWIDTEVGKIFSTERSQDQTQVFQIQKADESYLSSGGKALEAVARGCVALYFKRNHHEEDPRLNVAEMLLTFEAMEHRFQQTQPLECSSSMHSIMNLVLELLIDSSESKPQHQDLMLQIQSLVQHSMKWSNPISSRIQRWQEEQQVSSSP